MIVRFAIALMAGWVLALASGGCAHLPPAPAAITGPGMPDNLHCFVNEHRDGSGACLAYTSAQPTAAQFVAMHDKLHLAVVIKLNKPSLLVDGPHDEVPPGVEVWAHPLWPAGPITHEEIQLAVADLKTCVERARASGGQATCDLHCVRGVDRTRFIAAVYRVQVDGVSPEAAWREWRAFPRLDTDKAFYDAFEAETGFHIPEAER